MPSKMVTDREKTAALLSGTVDTFAQEASGSLLSLLEGDLHAGESLPDLLLLQQLLRRRLDRLRLQLVDLDEAHAAERHEDDLLRRQRDEAARELKTRLSRLRSAVDTVCGAGTCSRLLDVEGRISRDPVVLHRIASRFTEGLRQGFLDDGQPLLAGITLDTGAWIALLEEPMDRLDAALQGLALEKPETTHQQVDKAQALREYDRAYRATANIIESLFRYAGRPDLARRMRPKRRAPTEAGEGGAPASPLAPANDDALRSDPSLPHAAL